MESPANKLASDPPRDLMCGGRGGPEERPRFLGSAATADQRRPRRQKRSGHGRFRNGGHAVDMAGRREDAVLRREIEVNDPVVQNVDLPVVVEVTVVPAED